MSGTWETTREFESNLEDRCHNIVAKLKARRYHAPPVRRVHIPKGDGKTRPLGIPTVEDRLVQRAVTRILESIYEADFVDESYGFRRGRSPHKAIKALRGHIIAGKTSFVFETDIRGFFNHISYDWLMRMISLRIGDPVILWLVRKWLRAGALENGVLIRTREGSPQGPVSPMLANVAGHGAVQAAVEKGSEPTTFVVEEEALEPILREHFSARVKVERSLPEVNSICHKMETAMAEFAISYGHLSDTLLREFLAAAYRYYLEPLWLDIEDSEPFLLEGLTPNPLVVIVLGNAGVSYGLGVFEEPRAALGMLAGETPSEGSSFFFLDFLEQWKGEPLRTELRERELPHLPDTVPFVLGNRYLSQERHFRFMTDVLNLLGEYDLEGPADQELSGPSGRVTLTWPLSPKRLDVLVAAHQSSRPKPGRNDPCWCGCAKKYKKCHLGRD
jgi:hypothetical protein